MSAGGKKSQRGSKRIILSIALKAIGSWHLVEKGTSGHLGLVWYMCLKTENCCLKIFMEIRVGEKVR